LDGGTSPASAEIDRAELNDEAVPYLAQSGASLLDRYLNSAI